MKHTAFMLLKHFSAFLLAGMILIPPALAAMGSVSRDELDKLSDRIKSRITLVKTGDRRILDETLAGIIPIDDKSRGGIRLRDKLAIFLDQSESHGMTLTNGFFMHQDDMRFLHLIFEQNDGARRLALFLLYRYDLESRLLYLQDIHFSSVNEKNTGNLKKFFQYR